MSLSDHGLRQWSGQQPDREVWSSLRSFYLTPVGFAGASRFQHSTPCSAQVSLHKPGEVYRLPFNLFFCEMRVGVNLRAERLAFWLELSCVRECWGYAKGLVLLGIWENRIIRTGHLPYVCHSCVMCISSFRLSTANIANSPNGDKYNWTLKSHFISLIVLYFFLKILTDNWRPG